MRRALLMLGLGLVAGAVLHRDAGAQVRDTIRTRRDTTLRIPVAPGADSLLRDSLAKRDTIKRVPRDTVKAPISHAESPVSLTIQQRFHWNRDSLFATGAITVSDLLERVPGLTALRAGWISSPAVAAYMGDIRRVRVMYDGVELTGLDPRGQGVLDLTQVNLWSVEDAVIEPAADEVRVYLRSWRVRNTTPETRTDVSTGDQQTNLYRGYFGRRFDNGTAIQFGAQQYGTTPPSQFGRASDQSGFVGRVGWARPDWSVDAYATRIGRHRGGIFRETTFGTAGDSIPGVESTRTDAYVRIGFRDPDVSALWAQLMVAGSKYDYTGIRTVPTTGLKTAAESALAVTSLDTGIFRSQYIASVGAVRGPLRVSAMQRIVVAGGDNIVVPSVRGSFVSSRLGVSAFVEGKGVDSVAHGDVTAQLTPLSFVSLLGSLGRTSDHRTPESSSTTNYARGEVGLRVKNLWLIGGLLRRDNVRLSPPHIFDTTFTAQNEPSATGATVGIRGQLWRLVNADVSAIRWSDSLGFYRPRYQTRSELFIRTKLLERFPTGNFGLMASAIHEYRSGARFPGLDGDVLTVPGYRTISTQLEIRILNATVSWQFRNVLGERYKQVPSFIMPRGTNFYGVRWSFVD